MFIPILIPIHRNRRYKNVALESQDVYQIFGLAGMLWCPGMVAMHLYFCYADWFNKYFHRPWTSGIKWWFVWSMAAMFVICVIAFIAGKKIEKTEGQ